LKKMVRLFLTNHRAEQNKTKTNANNFRHSIENHTNLT